jgi:peptide/nickel transport system ATP-binding protein
LVAFAGKRPQLVAIPGQVSSPFAPPPGCAFAPRCGNATDRCRQERPPLVESAPQHHSACHLVTGAGQVAARP